MKNEEQLREETNYKLKQLRDRFEELFIQEHLCEEKEDGCVCRAGNWVFDNVEKLLHQAELNWLTEQIERGEGMRKENYETNKVDYHNPYWNLRQDGYHAALTDLLAPLIERKKEVEILLGRGEGV